MIRNMKKLGFIGALAAGLATSTAHAAIIYQQTFPTDTASITGTYPEFTVSGVATPSSVVGGVARLQTGTAASNLDLAGPGVTNYAVRADIGKTTSGGDFNVGIHLGNNRIVYHPGLNAGFRVEGTGGFGNTAMGFTPPGGSAFLNEFDVAVNTATGRVLVVVQNVSNPANTFVASYTNATLTPASPVGLTIEANATAGQFGLYDNVTITTTAEPANAFTSAIAASAPKHWYRFEETVGNIALDSGTAGFHAAYRNGTSGGNATPLGGGVRLDSTGDNVFINTPNLTGDWTAQFILQNFNAPGAAPASEELLIGGSRALKLEQWSNTGKIGYTAAGIADYTFTPVGDPAAVNTFDEASGYHQLTFVGTVATGVSLYLDGVLVGTNANYISLPLTMLGNTGTDLANVLIDELMIYDRALAAADIAAQYRSYIAAITPAVVPEPASLSLLAVAGLAMIRRERRVA